MDHFKVAEYYRFQQEIEQEINYTTYNAFEEFSTLLSIGGPHAFDIKETMKENKLI